MKKIIQKIKCVIHNIDTMHITASDEAIERNKNRLCEIYPEIKKYLK